MAIIHAVLRALNSGGAVRKAGKAEVSFGTFPLKRKDGTWQLVSEVGAMGSRADVKLNAYAIAERELRPLGIALSASTLRKAFDAAWKRQCPDERKPSAEDRRRVIAVYLQMLGEPLPRRWRKEPFVPAGDQESVSPYPPIKVSF